jgi:hypothetical protein
MILAQMFSLFAQAKKAAPPSDAEVAGILGGVMLYFICIGVFVIVMLVIQIMFLLNMSRTIAACKPRNRTVEPGAVWLAFIPLVGFIFHIIHLFKLPETLKNEYEDRGWDGDDDYSKTAAIIHLVVSFVFGCAAPITLIMLWMKHSQYKNELLSGRASSGRGRKGKAKRRPVDEDDEEDDDD